MREPARLSCGMARRELKRPKRRRTFLREWRKHRGLTQEQAADRIEISQATLSRIETGTYPYTQDFLEKAAFAYMCEPADLIMRNPLDADAMWSITDQLREVPEEERARVRAVIEAMIRKTG